jgi:hypothetical protein
MSREKSPISSLTTAAAIRSPPILFALSLARFRKTIALLA